MKHQRCSGVAVTHQKLCRCCSALLPSIQTARLSSGWVSITAAKESLTRQFPSSPRYREINPLDGATCLRLAKLYEDRGDLEKACRVLKEGIESLDCRRDYEPCIDGTVDDRYNRKAGETFKDLVESSVLLERELERLKSSVEKQGQAW